MPPAEPREPANCPCGRTVLVSVTIPADLSHTGEARVAEKPLDACIAGTVAALNAAGVETRGSCCGHGGPGEIILGDGTSIPWSREPDEKEGKPVMRINRKRTMLCRWAHTEGQWDWTYWAPNGPDRHLLHAWLSGAMGFHDFVEELKQRGYDIKSFRISVRRTPEKVAEVVEHEKELARLDDEDRAVRSCVVGEVE